MRKVVYYNVNEEEVPYDRHDNIGGALAVLEQFPNDTIVVCYEDAPCAISLENARAVLTQHDLFGLR